MMTEKIINNFRGKYSFLSNFYEAEIIYNDIKYKSTEYAYQCAKMTTFENHELVRLEYTPGRAKRLASKLPIKNNWDLTKLQVMKDLVFLKFSQYENLKLLLLQTHPNILIEENTWNDTFWGVCKGKGENYLGCLLMNLRKELIKK